MYIAINHLTRAHLGGTGLSAKIQPCKRFKRKQQPTTMMNYSADNPQNRKSTPINTKLPLNST